MRKIAAILSIIFGVAVLTISTSKTMMKNITDKRENAPWGDWWGPHQVAAGDLARMAYLEDIEKFHDDGTHTYIRAGEGNKKVNLYMYGDSYTKDIPDSAFYGLNSFHFGRRDYTELVYNLDPDQTNILVIAMGERFIRRFFYTNDAMFRHVRKGTPTAAIDFFEPVEHHRHYAQLPFTNIYVDSFFNPSVNQNIEYNLFTYNFMTPVRAFKAEMNAKLFKRASGDVMMSDDGRFLLLRETLTPTGMESSYDPIPEPMESFHISKLNEVYEHYKAEGFDQVYLAVIPNPVSIVQPELYNKFIPNIQNFQRGYPLKMPVIDIYTLFAQSPDPSSFYLKNDTHWNHKGTQLWIDKVNAMLRSWNSDQPDSTRMTW